jgi:hypothetical protein
MTAIQRRPVQLKKAEVDDDVVAGIFTPTTHAAPPEVTLTAADTPHAAAAPTSMETPDLVTSVPATVTIARRGPGRPRGRRRMEPFSSKIEIGLRDQIDEYIADTGESIVDLLDYALRAAITHDPGSHQEPGPHMP